VDNMHLNTLSSSSVEIQIDGTPAPAGREGFEIDKVAVDTGFFSAAGFRLLSGRNFTATDVEGAPRVVIVNQAFAQRFWPGRPAEGQRVRRTDGSSYEVIGVVNTAKIRSLGEDPRPAAYFSLMQWHPNAVFLVARTTGDADQLAVNMVRTIREVDPEIFFFQSRSMARHIEIMSLPIRLGALALAAFAGLALIMASTGLYGTVSYSVAQRTREVGIRLSLGADRSAVIRLLLMGGLRLVLIGVAAGLAASLLLASLLQSLLFGIHAIDPVTFVAVPVVLISVAFVAAWVPARRAGAVDPLSALRSE
jgi:predicted permease